MDDVTIYTMPQGDESWFQAKLGIPSAGSFSKILAKGQGKTRRTYMLKLAAEILTGTHRDTFQNADLLRGIEQEPQARREYEFIKDVSVDQIGFARKGRVGASPDGLVRATGGIEVKSVLPETQIETILANKIPPGHKPQIQGNIMVLDLEWMDFISYSPLLKNKNYIFIKRMYPDFAYIQNLQTELLRFIKELDELVKKMS